MYRFLLTPRWLGLAALLVLAALVMVELGNWQLHRYQEKSARNDRVDAAGRAEPVPVDGVLRTGAAPTAAQRYTKVLAAGRYDTTNEVLVRGRTVDGRVGFEVVTPLVLDSGVALLVNRGWVPPATGAADVLPQVPPAPPGRVEVVGAIRLPENGPNRVDRRDGRVGFEVVTPLVLDSGAALLVNRGWVPPATGAADALPQVPPPPPGRVEVVGAVRLPENGPNRVDRRAGRLVTRRIDPPKLATALPYPVLGGYVTTEQSGLTPIGVAYEGTLQNGGYALQWWAFAALTLVGYAYLARRHAHPPGPRGDRLDDPAEPGNTEPDRDHAGAP